MTQSESRWFSPDRHADRRPFLLMRNRILAAIRTWFEARDFLEVDCAALAISPGNEAHLHGFATDLILPDGSAERRYLHTSPEFACKKLLAAGETRIFNLGHVFRNRERTLTHSPEFTMLEWYRVREDYEVIIADTLALVKLAAETAGTAAFNWRGRSCAPLAEAEWLSVNEAHLHGFSTDLILPDGSAERRYLHTSPEFACKKLLAAGETRIFNLGHVFRNRERTLTHSPEFTMLEWYRVREDYEVIIADTLALVRLAAETAGTAAFNWRGRRCAPLAEAEWLSVNDAFLRHAGVDLLSTLSTDGSSDRDLLAKLSPVRVAADDTWSDIFSRILSEKVEPNLGNGRITVLYEYPAVEAALARTSARDPRVAERFELYACGVELANGFGELTDAQEQRRRFEAEMDLKEKIYGERYPIDEELLEALALMPPASGVALGLDRLIMLATGATRIDQVLWTPTA